MEGGREGKEEVQKGTKDIREEVREEGKGK